jgi:O-antigen ligase
VKQSLHTYYSGPLNFIRINIILVAITMLIWGKVGGFSIIGYSWVLMFLYSVVTILINRKINFPYLIWLPFILYFIGRLVADYSFSGMQVTLQYFTPIIAGFAASGFTYNEKTLQKIITYFKRFGIFLILISIFNPLIFGLKYGLGAHTVMTVIAVMTLLFSAFSVYKYRSTLLIACVMILIPFISVMRMAMLMTLLVFPLNFGRIKLSIRFIMLILFIGGSIYIFYSTSFQNKMFYSGQGRIQDISFSNPDFYTGGRSVLYDLLQEGIKESPYFGNGPRSELLQFKEASLQILETHNDYLAIRYSYGIIGLSILIFSLIMTFLILLRKKPKNKIVAVFRAAGLTLFIPFFGFMYTDNILKYTIFYGTIHFFFIAISFADFSQSNSKLQNETK